MKSRLDTEQVKGYVVSTLAVEWIEIRCRRIARKYSRVSTLAVEWIEMSLAVWHGSVFLVSTLAVEWIEILLCAH